MQLVNRPHFGTGIFLFGPLSSKGKKVDLRNSEQLFRVVFSTACNTERGFKESLSIALGVCLYVFVLPFAIANVPISYRNPIVVLLGLIDRL